MVGSFPEMAVKVRDLCFNYKKNDRGFELMVPSFELGSGETAAIIGESGSGKSTLLRIIAGLERGYSGTVELFGGPCFTDGGARRRDLSSRIAVMFQDAPLFRGTVRQNVAMGPEITGQPEASVAERVAEALELVGLATLAGADVRNISGGQARRVCFARALAVRPELLLLDEPLYSVDPVNKDDIITAFQKYRSAKKCASIIVTHDRNEALAISGRAVVMDAGRIIQDSSFYDCLENPVSERVARFVGRGALVYGTVVSCEDGLCEVDCPSPPSAANAAADKNIRIRAVGGFSPGESVCLIVNPDDVSIFIGPFEQTPESSALNRLPGVVRSHSFYEFGVMVSVEALPGISFPSYITRRSFSSLAVSPGLRVEISFKATSVTMLGLKK